MTYWIALVCVVGSIALVYLFLRSKQGLALLAIRDNEIAAESQGIAVQRMKGQCPPAHKVWLEPLVVPTTFNQLMPDLGVDPALLNPQTYGPDEASPNTPIVRVEQGPVFTEPFQAMTGATSMVFWGKKKYDLFNGWGADTDSLVDPGGEGGPGERGSPAWYNHWYVWVGAAVVLGAAFGTYEYATRAPTAVRF